MTTILPGAFSELKSDINLSYPFSLVIAS